MLKTLIILVLFIYIFYKVAGFLFQLIFGAILSNNPNYFGRKNQKYSKKGTNTHLDIDKVPQSRPQKKQKGYEGGEYVDFEEVE